MIVLAARLNWVLRTRTPVVLCETHVLTLPSDPDSSIPSPSHRLVSEDHLWSAFASLVGSLFFHAQRNSYSVTSCNLLNPWQSFTVHESSHSRRHRLIFISFSSFLVSVRLRRKIGVSKFMFVTPLALYLMSRVAANFTYHMKFTYSDACPGQSIRP